MYILFEDATKAYGKIAPRILNLRIWNSQIDTRHFIPGNSPAVPIKVQAGWASGSIRRIGWREPLPPHLLFIAANQIEQRFL
jgi:hypothetical protein